jgi:hypothetical protein
MLLVMNRRLRRTQGYLAVAFAAALALGPELAEAQDAAGTPLAPTAPQSQPPAATEAPPAAGYGHRPGGARPGGFHGGARPGGFGGGGGMRGGGFHGGRGGFGGGHRGGGHRGGGRGGGGGRRRSDFRLKHDIVLLGWLDDGLGYYRASSTTAAIRPMSESWRRRLRASRRKQWRAERTAICAFPTTCLDCRSKPMTNGWRPARICPA